MIFNLMYSLNSMLTLNLNLNVMSSIKWSTKSSKKIMKILGKNIESKDLKWNPHI